MLMVDISDDTKESKPSYKEKMKVVFSKAEEELIDFLNRCKLNDSKIMLCPCCNTILDKEVAKELEKITPISQRKLVDKTNIRSYIFIRGSPLKDLDT